MSFEQEFSDSDWDEPFFKVLANNDTGSAPGHQGGWVVPAELRPYFPALASPEDPTQATVDRRIQARLLIDGQYVETVQTRYQYQTWGGTRSPESRLTGNLSAVLNPARGGDLLVMQRHVRELDVFKLQVFTRRSQAFDWIQSRIEGKRWGVLGDEAPMSQKDLQEAETFLEESQQKALVLIDSDASVQTSRNTRVARSAAFRHQVLQAYQATCAVCGRGFRTPNGNSEAEAGHIVPRRLRGADDVRNGLAMCRSHHWALDKGLFGIAEDRTVLVPDIVREMDENSELARLAGSSIREANPRTCRAASEAFAWHRANVLVA